MKKLLEKYGRRRIGQMGGKRKGFTLIELLIVLTILAILVAVVTLSLTQFIGRGKTEACEADADAVQLASLAYYHDQTPDAWPVNGDALIAGGYIDKKPESDTDCDWGIGLDDTDLNSYNRICHGATGAATDCPCLTGLPACVPTGAATRINLW